jgi:hypothetical protein
MSHPDITRRNVPASTILRDRTRSGEKKMTNIASRNEAQIFLILPNMVASYPDLGSIRLRIAVGIYGQSRYY